MKNELDDNLDLLDLDDDAALDDLPAASPFAAPRPRKPWLLMGIGLLVIILATYIIIRVIGSDSGSSVDIDLGEPNVVAVDTPDQAVDTLVVPPTPSAPATPPTPVQVTPPPVAATPGVPVREVNDRRNVTFNPDKPAVKPAVKPAPKPAAKPAPKPTTAAASGWYVQFGSYSTRALAESAQKTIGSKHSSLFTGKQFVILAAVLPNGTTMYRLRMAFASQADANGFCRNAKSDGLDCYVAR